MNTDLKNLDNGQLDMMWNFLKLSRKNTCTKQDVRLLKEYLDKIRQAMIQKTANQDGKKHKNYVDFEDLWTYINLVVIQSMELYIHGGLDILEEQLK